MSSFNNNLRNFSVVYDNNNRVNNNDNRVNNNNDNRVNNNNDNRVNNINNNDNNNDIDDNNNNHDETYYYMGEHVDGCDQYGPIYVYHYISSAQLNGRNLNEVEMWDGDLELWPGDRLWSEASRKQNIIINVENV